MAIWVVPGAPLDGGEGWRVWYSQPGTRPVPNPKLGVKFNGRAVGFKAGKLKHLDAAPGLNRRMAVQEVRLDAPDPRAQTYEITIEGRNYFWKTMPGGIDEPVTFFISSCFWRDNDKEGAYGAGVRALTKLHKPAFKMLIGDQVYQDWPPAPLTGLSSAELYAQRYALYWGDPAYQEVFTSSPNYFLCDDHEFWNDYPERQAQLMRTWKSGEGVWCRRPQPLRTFSALRQRRGQDLEDAKDRPGGDLFLRHPLGTDPHQGRPPQLHTGRAVGGSQAVVQHP